MLFRSCCLPPAPKLFCMTTQALDVSAGSFIKVVLEIRILAAVTTNETTHNLEQECHNRERDRSRSIDRHARETPFCSKSKIGVLTADEMMSDNPFQFHFPRLNEVMDKKRRVIIDRLVLCFRAD